MPSRPGLFVSLIAAGIFGTAAAQNVPGPQLTARELFYAASQPAKPEAAQAAQPRPAKPSAKTAPRDTAHKPAVADVTRPKGKPPVSSAPPASAPAPNVDYSGLRVVNSVAELPMRASQPASGQSLGLRYSILKLSGSDTLEVPPNSIFHAGDRIQFSVQSNSPGYLYIVSQGSSGTWKPMFPSPDDGNNRIEAFRTYTMPPKSRIVFDEQTGTEKVFIVLSRQPETDIEQLIYSLRAKPQPSAAPEAPREPPLVIASAKIDDATVGRLRDTYSRDLIIEKVTPGTPGERKETAVYVVNPTGNADSRVVADLALVHQ